MATIYQRGTSWYLSWSSPTTGKQVRRSLGAITKRQAEALRRTKDAELALGHQLLPQLNFTVLTVADLVADYLDWRQAKYPSSQQRVARSLETQLVRPWGQRPAASISAEELDRMFGQLPVAKSTAHLRFSQVRAVFSWAIKHDKLTTNPMRALEAPKSLDSKPARFYTQAELERLYALDPAFAPVIRLIANTGLRVSEFTHLRWADIRDGTLYVVSTSAERTKSARWRAIPLLPGARQALAEIPKTSEYVSFRRSPKSVAERFREVLKRSDLTPPIGSIHCLRHTFISHLVQRGVPLRAVQLLAGHSSIAITEGYSHMNQDYLSDLLKEIRL